MHRYRRSIAIGKGLEQKINRILVTLILIFLLPIFITTFLSRLKVEELIKSYTGTKQSETEELLLGIVAKEIGILKPDECIKAQAIIARTNLLSAESLMQERPTGLTTVELKELWGEHYEAYYKRLKELISETDGQTLSWQGEPIYAAYHQVSAGNTRSMTEFTGTEQMTYLTGVPCHEDTTADNYLNVYFWKKDEFLRLMKTAFAGEVIEASSAVEVIKRDATGYVLQVKVGDAIYDGEEFRNRLMLPSSCFEISVIEEDIRIVTMGCGHGFGLSQHTAELMAENGAGYQEILEYFYKGVTLTE